MGHFSWIAQNSERSIIIAGYGTPFFPSKTYYMWDNMGRRWLEPTYEGYGIFGGKDYYVLLAEMNLEYGSEVTDDQKREDGLRMEGNDDVLYPNLTDCSSWVWHNIRPDPCPEQGLKDYECMDESDNEEYQETDEFDGWPNGETKPVPQNIVVRPKLMRESERRQQAIDFYKNSTDEEKYHHVAEELSIKYDVMSRDDGIFVNGYLFKNPVWVVKEKFHRWRTYDTTFVVYHCGNGTQAKFSIFDANKLIDFCEKNDEHINLYIKDEKLFGHCKNEANVERLNTLLDSICSNPEKDPRMWYQGFYLS